MAGHDAPAPRFQFRNEFWYNLDHFLYQVAQERRRGAPRSDAAPDVPLLPDERAGWERALAYYDSARAPMAIGFDSSLVATSFALAGRGDARLVPGEGLPPALTRALGDAERAYRRAWWPRHAAANAAFIARLDTLVREHGDAIMRQLARAYRVSPPAVPPVVEVVTHANWAGAYTLVDPTLITISSTYDGHRGTLALEQLYHEQSHAMMDSVDAALRAAGVAGRDVGEIAHWIIFYTAGEATRAAVPRHETFASWRGLWGLRGFDRGHALLLRYWRPYLDGQLGLLRAAADIAAGARGGV